MLNHSVETSKDLVADGLMREREVCRYFGVGPTTIYDWTRRGLLQSVKIRGSRRWLRSSVMNCALRHIDRIPTVRDGSER